MAKKNYKKKGQKSVKIDLDGTHVDVRKRGRTDHDGNGKHEVMHRFIDKILEWKLIKDAKVFSTGNPTEDRVTAEELEGRTPDGFGTALRKAVTRWRDFVRDSNNEIVKGPGGEPLYEDSSVFYSHRAGILRTKRSGSPVVPAELGVICRATSPKGVVNDAHLPEPLGDTLMRSPAETKRLLVEIATMPLRRVSLLPFRSPVPPSPEKIAQIVHARLEHHWEVILKNLSHPFGSRNHA